MGRPLACLRPDVGYPERMTATRRPLGDYPYTHALQTRWSDNDVYGHVNNVTYYAYFDTAVNAFLIREGLLDPERGDVIGLVVETGCQYFSSLSFPDALTVGVAVERLGNSSVRYRLGVFRAGRTSRARRGTSCTCTWITDCP